MFARLFCCLLLLIVAGCSSGFTAEELDEAVEQAVAAAVMAPAEPTTTASTMTRNPVPTTTSTQPSVSELAKEGQITYDSGILSRGTCTEIVREIEDVAGATLGGVLGIVLELADFDDESQAMVQAWQDSYLGPAWNIVTRVARDDSLPLQLTAYASNVSEALGRWFASSFVLANGGGDNSSIRQWLDSNAAVDDALRNYPNCAD